MKRQSNSKSRLILVLTLLSLCMFCVVLSACNQEIHKHTYESVGKTEATCTSQGAETFACSECGDRYTVYQNALGHDFKVSEEKSVAATCEAGGTEVSVCSRCGEIRTLPTAKLEHEYEKSAALSVAATCEAGGSDVSVCKHCGDIRTVTTAKLAHTYVKDVDKSVAATCEAGGSDVMVCELCGDTYSISTAKLAHEYEKSDALSVAATCEAGGSDVSVCKHCGDVRTVPTAKLAHKYGKDEAKSVAATCEAGGTDVMICEHCGDTYSITTAKLAHTFGEPVVVDPTCMSGGYTVHTCTACHYSYQDEFKGALGHSYEGIETVAPTCTGQGYTVFACEHCGDRYVGDMVAATGHDEIVDTIAPTCTEQGYDHHTCANGCGLDVKDNYIKALGHDFVLDEESELTVAETCLKNGNDHYACPRCGATEDKVVEATGHSLEENAERSKAATCTEDGLKVMTCTHAWCDKDETAETEEVLTKLGHIIPEGKHVCMQDESLTEGFAFHCDQCGKDIAIVEHTPNIPYSEVDCLNSQVCTVCETVLVEGQHVQTVRATCEHPGVCDVCGLVQERQLAHTYGDTLVTIKKATCTEDGLMGYVCTMCNKAHDPDREQTVSALGHEWSDWTVTAATCTADGKKVRTCATCGETETVVLPMFNHVYPKGHEKAGQSAYVDTEVAPTCTKDGYTTSKCALCGHEKDVVVHEGTATGHNSAIYGENAMDYLVTEAFDDPSGMYFRPTCSQEGMGAFRCPDCNQIVRMRMEKDPHNHSGTLFDCGDYCTDCAGAETADKHQKAECGTEGHFVCDGGDHTTYTVTFVFVPGDSGLTGLTIDPIKVSKCTNAEMKISAPVSETYEYEFAADEGFLGIFNFDNAISKDLTIYFRATAK